jgi:uncharacterized membrane protein YccC
VRDADPKPEGWTQASEDELEEAFYDLQKAALEQERAVAEVQALKDAQDALAAEADEKFQRDLQKAMDERPEIVAAYWDAKAAFEECKLDEFNDDCDIEELRW